MKVWELLEVIPQLEQADPEDVVVIDANAKSILLLNARPGLHQNLDERANCVLTEWDAGFLRSLGIGSDQSWPKDALSTVVARTPSCGEHREDLR